MRAPDEPNPFSGLTPFQRDMLFVVHMLGHGYDTKEWEAELPKAISRLLIRIAATTEKRHRDDAYFLAMLAQLFDPQFRADQLEGYPEFFVPTARRKVKLMMATKGHPKNRKIDETMTVKEVVDLFEVGERQAYRIKAKKKRGRKRN
jgi:hypothetical protein